MLHPFFAVFAFLLITHAAADSLNIEFEDAVNTDLSGLGEEGLKKHKGRYSVTVDDECQYLLKIEFNPHSSDNMKNSTSRHNFEDECDKGTGSALHTLKRYWLQFEDYVYDTTGFNHMSLYPRPCGLEPLGRRQPRYDVNFYNVPAYVRALWTCQSIDLPEKCSENQDSRGRGHFVVPRLNGHKDLIPNTPTDFQPDPDFLLAIEHEGLIVSNQTGIPRRIEDMSNPEYEMSTYDGDVASFRAILPLQYVSSNERKFKEYWGFPVYEYQTLPYLPYLWNVTFNSVTTTIEVYLKGEAQLCGEAFEQAKQEQEQSRI